MMFRILSLLCAAHILLFSININVVQAQFNPQAVPLAVRTPYLSTWLKNGSAPLSNSWPMFWGGHITGWAGYVRVDGVAYRFMGQSPGGQIANQTSVKFTATKSTFTFTAGPVTITADYLSPIEPTDLVKQSMPFSYLAVSVASNDGSAHSIQIYSDISAEWLSGDDSSQTIWQTMLTSPTIVHKLVLPNAQAFTEIKDQSQFSTVYYGITNGNGVTYQSGADVNVRAQFISNGVLLNSNDTHFRAVSDSFPVFGLSVDLGNTLTTSAPVVYAVGLAPADDGAAVEFVQPSPQPLQPRFLYFQSQMTVFSAFQSFIADYKNAASRASNFDSQISSDAQKVSSGSNYADLLAISARQAFAGTFITISKDNSGQWNTSDLLVFMKEISSAGDVNTVDVIYPSFPIFLYTNPTIARYLLEPVLQYMEQGNYNAQFVPHDLGKFPIGSGANSKTENMPVEESANMIIMALAAARASGDGNILSNHYNTLKGAADYLVANTLIPANQASTDDFLGAQTNTSNLALKGIIALQAMSSIRSALKISDTNPSYADTAKSYIQQWQTFAISSDGKTMLSTYNDPKSFAMPYNLFADKLLGTNIVPQAVYTMAQSYVGSFAQPFGVVLDSRQPTNSKTDWMLFTAGAISDAPTRDKVISLVHSYVSAGKSNDPFPDYYDVVNGTAVGFEARPVQGAMFSLLAANQPAKPITFPAQASSNSSSPGSSPPSPSSSSSSASSPNGPAGTQFPGAALAIHSTHSILTILSIATLPLVILGLL